MGSEGCRRSVRLLGAQLVQPVRRMQMNIVTYKMPLRLKWKKIKLKNFAWWPYEWLKTRNISTSSYFVKSQGVQRDVCRHLCREYFSNYFQKTVVYFIYYSVMRCPTCHRCCQLWDAYCLPLATCCCTAASSNFTCWPHKISAFLNVSKINKLPWMLSEILSDV